MCGAADNVECGMHTSIFDLGPFPPKNHKVDSFGRLMKHNNV